MEHDEIFKQLNFMAKMVSAPFYWLDIKGRFVGLNKKALKAIGAKRVKDVLGKTAYDIYPEKLADVIWKDIQKVITKKQDSEIEDVIVDLTSGMKRYYLATRSPILDGVGKVIGIIGTSIEITAQKEAEQQKREIEHLKLENQRLEIERLQLDNERHGEIAKDRENGMKLADSLFRHQQSETVKYQQVEAGEYKLTVDEKIRLSLWDLQVLFAIYKKRNAKSAAEYLSRMTGKKTNHEAVNSILNKSLYPKFGVNNQTKLIEKALLLKMIPFFFPIREEF